MTLDFLVEFAWEHDAWDMTTADVVAQLIAPATAKAAEAGVAGGPRCASQKKPTCMKLNNIKKITYIFSLTHQSSACLRSPRPQLAYTALLPPGSLGLPTHFISHAWRNPFGLVVAVARKFISAAAARSPRGEQRPFLWLDIFAVTQHPGEHQVGRESTLSWSVLRGLRKSYRYR